MSMFLGILDLTMKMTSDVYILWYFDKTTFNIFPLIFKPLRSYC